jgi:UDP-N-acetylmuramate dehydrogenase
MIVSENVPLRSYNTFGINSTAKKVIDFENDHEITGFFSTRKHSSEKYLILGCGSNILFTSDFDGTIIRLRSQEYSVIKENKDYVWIKGDAGLNWNHFVLNTLKLGYQGLENLTLIPGTLGAAPIQNIGAYGVEIENFLESVDILDIESGAIQTLKKKECGFGYRNSIFKESLRWKAVILNVTLRLNKIPRLNISYRDIQNKLQEKGIKDITALMISSLVSEIRKSKLPDPAETGNAGSVFKNPVISMEDYKELKSEFSTMPVFPVNMDKVKVPAAWLIEQCGWKGVQKGNVAVSSRHSLIIINTGQATGMEIYALIQAIKKSVLEKFKIELELEINVV